VRLDPGLERGPVETVEVGAGFVPHGVGGRHDPPESNTRRRLRLDGSRGLG
jgi:hypothetical protein